MKTSLQLSFDKTVKCIDCHFFCYQRYHNLKASVLENQRELIKTKGPDSLSKEGMDQIGCYFEVWGTSESLWKHEYDKERLNRCFYWKHVKEMTLKAGATLQKREDENSALNKQIRRTNWGLLISALALFLSTAISIANFFKST